MPAKKKVNKISKPRNLNTMIQELDPVNISIADIENLALQLVFESDRAADKISALRIMVDIKKSLSTDDNQKELLQILKGD